MILVVEDDSGLGAGLVRLLEGEGYETHWCRTGREALAQLTYGVDLVLLDLGLPDMDGLDLCRTIHRDAPALPILVLTARGFETDVVLGLNAGAMDYLIKPFRLAELLARLRVHHRTTRAADEIEDVVTVGDVTVDIAARRVFIAGTEAALRAKEFDLLTLLVSNAGRTVTRSVAMTQVWDEHWHGSTKTLDVHIAALRKRFGEDDVASSRITTLRGVGYRFELPPDPGRPKQ